MSQFQFLDISHHQGRKVVGGYEATIDMPAVKAAGCPLIIIRTNYGKTVDGCAVEHIRRADAAGLPRTHYWYNLTRRSPEELAELSFKTSGNLAGRRFYIDIEEHAAADGLDPLYPRYSNAYFSHVNAGLQRMDSLSSQTTGIYSSKTYLDFWFTKNQQRVWADAGRFGWWAQYPNEINPQPPSPMASPWTPIGYIGTANPWGAWQFTGNGRWSGVQGPVDISVNAPGVTATDILGLDNVSINVQLLRINAATDSIRGAL